MAVKKMTDGIKEFDHDGFRAELDTTRTWYASRSEWDRTGKSLVRCDALREVQEMFDKYTTYVESKRMWAITDLTEVNYYPENTPVGELAEKVEELGGDWMRVAVKYWMWMPDSDMDPTDVMCLYHDALMSDLPHHELWTKMLDHIRGDPENKGCAYGDGWRIELVSRSDVDPYPDRATEWEWTIRTGDGMVSLPDDTSEDDLRSELSKVGIDWGDAAVDYWQHSDMYPEDIAGVFKQALTWDDPQTHLFSQMIEDMQNDGEYRRWTSEDGKQSFGMEKVRE